MRRTRGDAAFEAVVLLALVLMCFTMLYPFWNSVVISFNDGKDTMMGGITLWPREFTLENYRYVFKDDRILNAFGVTVMRTLVGTLISVTLTAMFAFALTKRQLRFRRLYLGMAVLTMYFGGGMIPSYLVVRMLGLRDTFWVLVIPGAVNVWNMIIFRSFFQGVPASLEESARIDGAGYYRVFFQIVTPVSLPVISTLALFTAVNHWNSWFDAAIYISSRELMPIQNLLQQIINTNSLTEMMSKVGGAAAENLAKTQMTTKSLTMATMVVATAPILMAYPFIQRYFVQGVMIGSLKE